MYPIGEGREQGTSFLLELFVKVLLGTSVQLREIQDADVAAFGQALFAVVAFDVIVLFARVDGC